MIKNEQIEYLNRIKPFINLKAVCNDYNLKTDSSIDYNNLRAILNGVSKTRLSEEKLNRFISYLYQHLYLEIFKAYDIAQFISTNTLSKITERHINNLKNDIIREIQNELYFE